MIATFVRNSKYSDSILYFGPMGCQTGFYLLVNDDVSEPEVLNIVKEALKQTAEYSGRVFGASEIECGNYRNLDLDCAKKVCAEYLEIIKDIDKIKNYDEVNAE